MLTEAELERIRGIRPSFLGSLFYYLLPIRRGVVLENMRQVFGDSLDEAEIRRLARCFYTHFLRAIVENLSMFWTSDRGLAARVEVQGEEHLFRAGEQGKGILLLTGHFGNWEQASIGAMLQFDEFRNRFHAVRKSLSAGLEQLIFRRFRSAGLRVILRFDALGQVLRHTHEALQLAVPRPQLGAGERDRDANAALPQELELADVDDAILARGDGATAL